MNRKDTRLSFRECNQLAQSIGMQGITTLVYSCMLYIRGVSWE